MKITDVKLTTLSLGPRPRPVSDATYTEKEWTFSMVEVFTDEGVTGVGEGGGWPFLVAKAIEEMKHFLIGENPFEIERLWLRLYDILHGHGATGAVRGGLISAIDCAL